MIGRWREEDKQHAQFTFEWVPHALTPPAEEKPGGGRERAPFQIENCGQHIFWSLVCFSDHAVMEDARQIEMEVYRSELNYIATLHV